MPPPVASDCAAADFCTIHGLQCPLAHQDADFAAAYQAIGDDDKWVYQGELVDGRPWFQSDSVVGELKYLYYSERAGGYFLTATMPELLAAEPWTSDNIQVRLYSQFPGDHEYASLYCGHHAGEAAAGCQGHERDDGTVYYWCDNWHYDAPVAASCTCNGPTASGPSVWMTECSNDMTRCPDDQVTK